MPVLELKDNMGREISNDLLKKKKEQELMEVLKTQRTETFQTISDKIKNDNKDNKTDIMSSLLLAEKIFKNYTASKTTLVIFSDMMENSKSYDFYKEKLSDSRIEAILKKEKSSSKTPDLKSVRVYIVAATSEKSDKFLMLQNFWLKYFAATGADLAKENYGSMLLKIE